VVAANSLTMVRPRQEHRFCSPGNLGHEIASGSRPKDVRDLGKVELEGRAFARLAFDLNVTGALLTIPKQVASPKPVPLPGGLVVKKGSKRCALTSGVIPVPVSAIASIHVLPGLKAAYPLG